MKKIGLGLIISLTLAVSGCASNNEEGLYDNVPEASFMAEADNPDMPQVDSGKKIKEKTDLGDGLKDDKPVITDEPIDKGLLINLPAADPTNVAVNEKVIFSLAQQEPGAKLTGSIFYYEDGANNSTFDIGEFTVGEEGIVNAEVVIPSNLTPGTYAFSLTSDEGLYTAPIVVK